MWRWWWWWWWWCIPALSTPTLSILNMGGPRPLFATEFPSDVQLHMHDRFNSKNVQPQHPHDTRGRNCSAGYSMLTNTEKEFFEIKPKMRVRVSARCTTSIRSLFNGKIHTRDHAPTQRRRNCSEVGRKSDGNGRLPGDAMVVARRRRSRSPFCPPPSVFGSCCGGGGGVWCVV